MTSYIRVLSFILLLQVIVPAQPKQLTLEDLFSRRELYGRSLSGVQWVPGAEKFTFLKFDPASASYNIFQHDIKTGEESVLVSGSDLKLEEGDEPFRIQNYKWSPDGKYILFTGVLPARTLKSGGTFYLYNAETKKFFIAAESEKEQVNAAFSPDGRKLGFVRGNNIFVTDIESGEETQLTFDGNENILNGLFDWVYEEEFSIIVGWEWAPDSKSIAYWRLDQTNVPEVFIPDYDSLYMQPQKMKYPKPGAPNSLVQIGVVDIASAKTVWMDLGAEKDIYVPRMKFTNDPAVLAIQRLNRLQNKLELLFADTRTGKTKTIITETSDAWVDVVDDLLFPENSKEFIWGSERDGFYHLYLYDMNGNLINQVTKGNWEIKALTGADQDKIYFTASERSAIYTDFYSVNYDGSEMKRLSEKPGTHTINMAPDDLHYIDRYNNANSLTAISLNNTAGEKISDLVVPDMSAFKDYNFVPVEFITVTTSDGVGLNACIMKPADLDPSKKYPVIFDIYGGPESQSVVDMWTGFGSLLNQYFVQNGYIIFSLDNRGTTGRGSEFRHIVYKNLGKWEVNDMIEGAKYLISKGYTEPGKIGIWGGSYGGYTAAMTLFNGADYFSAAVDNAGLSDWRFYDNIYTERYMQTPELNPEGYDSSSVLNYAEKLKGKLLIVHGMDDDNVHFQNAVKLAEKLIEMDKQFEVMFYPGQKHGVHGNSAKHYYKRVIDFFDQSLKGMSPQQNPEHKSQ